MTSSSLERQLERSRQLLDRQPGRGAERARRRRRVPAARARARRRCGAPRRGADVSRRRCDSLRPGDVLVVRRRGGRVVVLGAGAPPGRHTRIARARHRAAQVVRLGPEDFDAPPRRGRRTIELPQPFAPRSPAFRRAAPSAPAPRPCRDDGARRATTRAIAELEAMLADHPARRDPQLDVRGCAPARRRERLEREVARLERRVRGRSESLARQFDRVLRVLEAWGYVDGWALTAGGRAAGAALHRDRPARRRGDPRRPARRPDARPSSPRWCRASPTSGAGPTAPRRCRRRAGRRKTVAQAGPRDRADRGATSTPTRTTPGLPETRRPDPGFTPYVVRLGGGRRARRRARRRRDDRRRLRPQRQAVHRPPPPDRRRRTRPDTTRRRAREAADACYRGVVAASSVAGVSTPGCRADDREGRAVGTTGRRTARRRRRGDDTDLARRGRRTDRALRVRVPSRRRASDFARAVGLSPPEPRQRARRAVPATRCVGRRRTASTSTAVNMVVLGIPPDRLRWWSRSRRRPRAVDGARR